LNSLLGAFSAELLTVILCWLLVAVITHWVVNSQQSNFSLVFLNISRIFNSS